MFPSNQDERGIPQSPLNCIASNYARWKIWKRWRRDSVT